MHISLADIAAGVGGSIVGDTADANGSPLEISGATQDSRAIEPGQLFIPVIAERDGHDFIESAVRAGAPAYLSSQPVSEPVAGSTAIVVDDTISALQRLGRLARERIGGGVPGDGSGQVVGITGSAGKTSTKDLVAAAISSERSTHASEKSFNNELGVPLTLLNAADDTEVAVVEMGARGPGHIALLCDIASPTIGVVTTVGNAHTSEFGSFEAVVEGKGELIESLPSSGTAVLNVMVPEVAGMAKRSQASVVTFGVGAGDVRAVEVVINDDLTSRFRIETGPFQVEPFDVALGARGEHNVANAAAAAAVGLALGVSPEAIAAGLAKPKWSPWRMEMTSAPSGLIVVNDSYNANPLSVSAALASLAKVPAVRRVAVLGVMAELGDEARSEHERIAREARDLGIEVVAVDAPLYGADVNVAQREEVRVLLGELGDGVAVLVKGSRVAGLEHLAEELLSEA